MNMVNSITGHSKTAGKNVHHKYLALQAVTVPRFNSCFHYLLEGNAVADDHRLKWIGTVDQNFLLTRPNSDGIRYLNLFYHDKFMPNSLVTPKAFEIIFNTNKAIANLRLYPASNTLVENTINNFHQTLQMFFEQQSSLVFAESEKKLLIGGEPLNKIEREMPQVKAFLELLLDFGIKSVTFERGLGKKDLLAFLEIMAKRPETVSKEGGFLQLLAGIDMSHILVDNKIYVVKDGEHQIVAGLDIKDDDIVQYITGTNPELNLDLQQVRQLAKDPEWMTKIVQMGVTNIMQQKSSIPNNTLSEHLACMIGNLGRIIGKDGQDKMSLLAGKAIAALDEDVICRVLAQNAESLLDGKFIRNVISEMDEEKFEGVMGRIRSLESDQGIEASESLIFIKEEKAGRLCDLFMASDKGKQLQQRKLDKEALDNEVLDKEVAEMQTADVRALIEPILLRDEKAILDKSLMAILPRMIDRLNKEEDYYTVEALIQRLAESLLSTDRNVPDSASGALDKAINSLPFEQQIGIIHELSETFIQWITLETSATSAYANICRKLKAWVEALIRNKQFAAGIPLLDTFHKIDTGVLDKDDAIRCIVSDIIRELSAQDILNILFEELLEGEEKNRKDAGHILGRLGVASLNRLLDVLRESDDSDVRVQILHIFSEIETAGISVIAERIVHEEPWYFLRNLAYMLGRISHSTVAPALEPLLLHENKKVQQEAMKSLYRAGGSERGPVLLSVLDDADELLQMEVVEMLGNLKYSPAVPRLTDLLSIRPLITTLSRIDLEEKICVALGKIGSQDAVPVLTEIGKPKSFLTLTTYHEKVKYAAAKALEQLS